MGTYNLIERTKIEMKLRICILLAALAVMTEGTMEGLRGVDQLEESTVDVTRRLPFVDGNTTFEDFVNGNTTFEELNPFDNFCVICSGPGENDVIDILCNLGSFVLCLLNICTTNCAGTR